MKERKILIVDFDEESLVALSDLVNEEGFKAVIATDGLAGYEKFMSDEFDLVILEPMLPRLHGFELCKKIIQDPLKKVPIIVVTGIYREAACRTEAIHVYGASAFFTKPWNKEELRAKILELLARHVEAQPREEEIPIQETAPVAPPPSNSPPLRASSRESKFSSDLDEIERELREAVAGLGKPAPKKEIKEIKEKKAPKKDLDHEVEAILKGAISELGLEEVKKKPAPSRPGPVSQSPPSVKTAPPVRPVQAPESDVWKEPKRPVAREIQEDLASWRDSTNNIPSATPREFDTEKTPFGLERTLREIDRMSVEVEKPIPILAKELEKEKEEEAQEDKKRYYFEEYAEPKKKKTVLFAASAIAAILVLATSLIFVVFKPKKSSPPPKEMVSSLTPSLPTEFSTRQQEVTPSITEVTSEPVTAKKPEAKKVSPGLIEGETEQAEEIVTPIVPEEPPHVELHVEAELPPETPPANKEESTVPPAAVTEQSPPSISIERPENKEPPASKPQPGALIPLADVSIPPILLKRVNPKYPTAALNFGMEGTVTVNALISETGEVIRTEILKGVKGGYGFEKAAENAVKQWLFRPAQKNGVNVKVWKPIEITFKLNQNPSKE